MGGVGSEVMKVIFGGFVYLFIKIFVEIIKIIKSYKSTINYYELNYSQIYY